MKYKLKFERIHFENNWKNGRIFKLIEFYFMFTVSAETLRSMNTRCRPLFRFALLNFGFVIYFKTYIICKN